MEPHPLIGKLVIEVEPLDILGEPKIQACLCTLDEYLDGHRHQCDMHRICFECLEDYQEDDHES